MWGVSMIVGIIIGFAKMSFISDERILFIEEGDKSDEVIKKAREVKLNYFWEKTEYFQAAFSYSPDQDTVGYIEESLCEIMK